MMPGPVFRTLLVTAAAAPAANDFSARLGDGHGWWTTPTSATGEDPPQWYIASGHIPDNFAEVLPCSRWKRELLEDHTLGPWQAFDVSHGDPSRLVAALLALDPTLQVTEDQIVELFLQADISDQGPFEALNRLQLHIITPPLEIVSPLA